MPKEYSRTERLSELLQRELAILIQQEVKDPRLSMVTVSAVKVSRDLAHAKVYVTVLTQEENIKNNIRVLNHAASFLRSLLAKRVKMRVIPELSFHYDKTIIEGNRLANLIEKAVSEDEKRAHERDDEEINDEFESEDNSN